MVDPKSSKESAMLESVSVASKQFYSAGSAFSTVGCAAIVLFAWGALARLYPPFQSELCGLVLSFMIVLAYALVIPEPRGYPNAGKLRVTLAEFLFGFINSFIVFSSATALKAL